MLYFVKTPVWLQQLFPERIWKFSDTEKKIYLTFDDGPHPDHTPFVLDILKQFNAKATFFCIGKNVCLYPDIYQRIIEEGHSTGNHTFNHLNSNGVKSRVYIEDVLKAAIHIKSRIFRPPFGRLNSFRARLLSQISHPFKVIMWTVLSGDFDPDITKERCLENVILNTEKGSIVVFHDSDKASEKMRYVLPVVLKYFNSKGYDFKNIFI